MKKSRGVGRPRDWGIDSLARVMPGMILDVAVSYFAKVPLSP